MSSNEHDSFSRLTGAERRSPKREDIRHPDMGEGEEICGKERQLSSKVDYTIELRHFVY